MSCDDKLLPFQQFAQSWKGRKQQRDREDRDVEERYAAQQRQIEDGILQVDRSFDIQAQADKMIKAADRKFAEQIAALRERHEEEVAAMMAWRDKKLAENEESIRQRKDDIKLRKQEIDMQMTRNRESLRRLRQEEDAEVMATSMRLLEDEAKRLDKKTFKRPAETSPETNTTSKQPQKRIGKPLRRTTTLSQGQSMEKGHASTMRLQPHTDFGQDELQQGTQRRVNARKRLRLEDLSPEDGTKSQDSGPIRGRKPRISKPAI